VHALQSTQIAVEWLRRTDSALGFNPEHCTHLGRPADSWRTSPGVNKHRLEAYPTLVFRTIEWSLRAILGAIAVNLTFDLANR